MKRTKTRVFLDSNVFIAGLCSPLGASNVILSLCSIGFLELLTAKQVLIETERNLRKKFPQILKRYHLFLEKANPMVLPDPSQEDIALAAQIIHKKDAPILAVALKADIDFLISLDARHFAKMTACAATSFDIINPEEFLTRYKQ
ncbi:MAG: PIN domain-containing protein [Armatimonadetes bacterium]|nr:PIN domain-containing protein [Armatimonadota bacterium]